MTEVHASTARCEEIVQQKRKGKHRPDGFMAWHQAALQKRAP